jgi:hypothetical protein
LLVLLAAGCGGEEPRLPRDLAEQLAARSDAAAARLESGEECAGQAEVKALQAAVIEAVNSGRVPGDLQEELLGHVNALVEVTSCPPIPGGENAPEEARALADWLREKAG